VEDAEILGLPNPVIWWTAFFLALPVCLFWAIAKRDETAALLVFLLAPLVAPWLVYSRPLFMFYMTPAVPILVLLVVHVMQRWRLQASAIGFVVLAVAMFAYFYPVLAALPIPATGFFGWNSHIWFGHGFRGDCTSEKIKLLCWI
jgi:dolichyl-phosphate-mannose--protein O-mannosyl transferase